MTVNPDTKKSAVGFGATGLAGRGLFTNFQEIQRNIYP